MNVLVLGDGLLGSELCRINDWDFVSRSKHGFDITDESTYVKMMPCTGFTIVNCVANTDTYSNDRDSIWEVNISGTRKLIDFCNKWGAKIVQISSDYIYTNSKEGATEEDVPVHNQSWYGYSKLVSDAIVQEYAKNSLVIRCTHKPNPFSFDEAWVDQVGNFDYVDKIADMCSRLILNNASGVYNVGTETKSMYDLAKKTKDVSVSHKPNQAPGNVTMDVSKTKLFIGEFN
jgi:dTDP-4-dehydrorhamnose reductase